MKGQILYQSYNCIVLGLDDGRIEHIITSPVTVTNRFPVEVMIGSDEIEYIEGTSYGIRENDSSTRIYILDILRYLRSGTKSTLM